MIKLIDGEIYRILHKKSMYIYFCSLAAGYFLLAFIRSGGFKDESVVSDAINFFNFLPAIAGGFLFSAIYTDDLNSKNLISLVGFGVNKTKIVTAKLILTVMFGTVIFALAPVFHYAVYAVLGSTATSGMMTMIYAVSLKYLLTTIAFAALSGIAVYGLQRTTFAIVLYILLAFNVIGSMIAVALKTFAPDLVNYLISGITDRIFAGMINAGSVTLLIVEYIIYVIIAGVLSVLVFYKKEMEF